MFWPPPLTSWCSGGRTASNEARPGAALKRKADAIDGGMQQAAIGCELLQRADAAGGAEDGDEIAGRELRVDVVREHLPHVGGALARQAEIVDDDGHDPAGALAGRQPDERRPAAAAVPPRPAAPVEAAATRAPRRGGLRTRAGRPAR